MMQTEKYLARCFLSKSLLLLSVEFVLCFIRTITKFSFSLFVHDPSFTMVKCRKCSTLSIRRTEETSRVHVFCFPKCGLNHCIAARSVIRMSLKKYLISRGADLTPGSRSRNHMQHAAERLSQQLCLLLSSTNTMRDTNTNTLSPTVAANTGFIHFFYISIVDRQAAGDLQSTKSV